MSEFKKKEVYETIHISVTVNAKASVWMSFSLSRRGERQMQNQEHIPCNKQIHIKLSEEDLERIRNRMEQIGVRNKSTYIRKMAKLFLK